VTRAASNRALRIVVQAKNYIDEMLGWAYRTLGKAMLVGTLGAFALLVCSTRLNAESNQEKYTNRLIHEKSPYLLQHAHNGTGF